MRRRKKFLVASLIVMGFFAGMIIFMNMPMFAGFLTNFLAPNAVTIVVMVGAVFIIGIIIYKLAAAGELKFDWWIFKKITAKGKLMDRDRARDKSKNVLEQEYRLETGLVQMHRRELSLVADVCIDTETGRKPFAVFFWTTLSFTGRRHNLEQIVRNHFDQLHIVEVNLSNGYTCILPWDEKQTIEWLMKKHVMSKAKEEDTTMKTIKEKFFEGAGMGAGQKAVESATGEKESKEGEER